MLSIMFLIVRLSVVLLSVVLLSVVLLSVVLLNVVMLNVIMLSVVMLSVIILNAMLFFFAIKYSKLIEYSVCSCKQLELSAINIFDSICIPGNKLECLQTEDTLILVQHLCICNEM
jgi:hypothetical protein